MERGARSAALRTVPYGIAAKVIRKRAASQSRRPDFNPRTKRFETRVRGAEIEALFHAVPFWLFPVRVAPVPVFPLPAEELGNLVGKRNLNPTDG